MINSNKYYVISAEGHYDGEKEIRYVGSDVGYGGYYTGYPCWVNDYTSMGAKKFTNKEDAKKYLFSEHQYLIDRGHFKVDKSTISIMEVCLVFVEKIDVDDFVMS